MAKFCCALLSIIVFLSGYSQDREVLIQLENDYGNPDNYELRDVGTKHFEREVKNGMYIGKGLSVIGPELRFSRKTTQLSCVYHYDAEFDLVKLKGGKNDYYGIEIELSYRGEDFFERQKKKLLDMVKTELIGVYFKFNESGNWQLLEGNNNRDGKPLKTGKLTVNERSNKLKLLHRKNKIEFYLNGAMVCEWTSTKSWQSKWSDIEIFGETEKFQVALDHSKITGYFDKDNPEVYFGDIYGFNTTLIQHRDAIAIREINGTRYRLMDNRGRRTSEEYDEIETRASPGKLIRVRNGKLYGYVDEVGKVIFPCEFPTAAIDVCFVTKQDCYKDHYAVKDKDGKLSYLNEKGARVGEGETQVFVEPIKKEEKPVSTEGMQEILTSKYRLKLYQSWMPYHKVIGDSYITVDASLKNSPTIFASGPASWLNGTGTIIEKGISGSMRLEWEERESSFEKEKNELVTYFATQAATVWDKTKSAYTDPTAAQIAKAKTGIKIMEDSITMDDGRKGRSLFYCAGVPGLGIRLAYIIIIPDLKDKKKISYYEVFLGGEPNGQIKKENFKEWNDYFKKVMLSIRLM